MGARPIPERDGRWAPQLMKGMIDAANIVIDEGMRRWYRACPCCLSEAYPEVKRALDVESQPTLPSTVVATSTVEHPPDGGDPACWAHLVCPGCGEVGGHRSGCPVIPISEVS